MAANFIKVILEFIKKIITDPTTQKILWELILAIIEKYRKQEPEKAKNI